MDDEQLIAFLKQNNLIKQGAKLVNSYQDIIEEIEGKTIFNEYDNNEEAD